MINFSKARVAVVGDLIEDHWIYGRVDRLSPEGPWPVFVPEKTVKQPGGAANVYQNMKALGATPYLITSNRAPSIKERYVAGRHQLFRVDREDTSPIDAEELDLIYRSVANLPERPDVVVLSDYGKGVFGGPLAQRLIRWCNGAGIKTVVDPKGDWDRYRGATIITPNAKEFDEANQEDFHPWSFMAANELGALLITHGEKGMTLWDDTKAGSPPVHIPATGPRVVDVVGAGDSVVAALALGIGSEMSLDEAAKVASAVAGVVVGKPGTAVCTLAELEEAYARH